MANQHNHWRNLGRGPDTNPADKSTAAIMKSLATPQPRHPVTSHQNVASVGADGIKPTHHNCDCGPNTAANKSFNDAAKGPNERPNVVMVGGK